jgi:hypothetical protein
MPTRQSDSVFVAFENTTTRLGHPQASGWSPTLAARAAHVLVQDVVDVSLQEELGDLNHATSALAFKSMGGPPNCICAGQQLGEGLAIGADRRPMPQFPLNNRGVSRKWFKSETAPELRFRRSEAVFRSG